MQSWQAQLQTCLIVETGPWDRDTVDFLCGRVAAPRNSCCVDIGSRVCTVAWWRKTVLV